MHVGSVANHAIIGLVFPILKKLFSLLDPCFEIEKGKTKNDGFGIDRLKSIVSFFFFSFLSRRLSLLALIARENTRMPSIRKFRSYVGVETRNCHGHGHCWVMLQVFNKILCTKKAKRILIFKSTYLFSNNLISSI